MVSPDQITQFQAYVFGWYSLHGRHQLPWRHTTNLYEILVSEVMLQQTLYHVGN